MTDKLYYIDSHIYEFTTKVLSCQPCKKGFAVTLDKTAFFPEGGGQLPDTGVIGEASVLDVQEKAGEILHYTDRELEAGSEYSCTLDWEQRRRRMQNHSGEHIVSGITNRLYGFDNVGFHMGDEFMTLDFSGELTWDQLMGIEKLANEAVRDNLPIIASFPSADELPDIHYRSKLELTENVRIVEIPGIDCCACCAPHVKNTGEIGFIKVLSSERHRGGVRVNLVCGMDALDTMRVYQENVTGVSKLLSAKRENASKAVERILSEQAKLKEKIAALGMESARRRADSFKYTEGNICVFDDVLDEIALREMVNMLVGKCSGLAAAFSGNDEEGYRYIIASRSTDLKANAKTINAGIGGRGGGSSEMIQGRAANTRENIENYIFNMSV